MPSPCPQTPALVEFEAVAIVSSFNSRINEHLSSIVIYAAKLAGLFEEAAPRNSDVKLSMDQLQWDIDRIIRSLKISEGWVTLEGEDNLNPMCIQHRAPGDDFQLEEFKQRMTQMVGSFARLVDLRFDFKGLPQILGYPDLLWMVFESLIIDAAKNARIDGLVELKTRQSGRKWHMELIDHTGGLPLPRSPGSSVNRDRPRHPISIGLRMTALMAVKLNGVFRVQANPVGAGALIKLELPLKLKGHDSS